MLATQMPLLARPSKAVASMRLTRFLQEAAARDGPDVVLSDPLLPPAPCLQYY